MRLEPTNSHVRPELNFRLYPFAQDGERARIAVDRHTERLRHAVGGDVALGRPTGGEDIDAATPERIDCVDDP